MTSSENLAGVGRIRSDTMKKESTKRILLASIILVLAGVLTAVAFSSISSVDAATSGKIRTFYIAADEVNWDYAPSGMNQITNASFDEEAIVFVQNMPFDPALPLSGRIGRVYKKALYREYTDALFTTLKQRPAKWQHLGALGPVIQAEVGDTIKVVFKNNAQFPFSVHPHGVFYNKDSEGAPYNDGTSGANKNDDVVPPGGMHTYTWLVPERAGPTKMETSSILWMYHSHVDESDDTNGGLIGPIIITRKGMAKPDGSPKDVDREFVTLFTIFDENISPFLDQNIETFIGTAPADDLKNDPDFQESNLMHNINGYVYGNLPLETLMMKRGERVRWYVMGMGTEVDLHTPHWHANTLTWNGMRTDMVELLPVSMKTLDMTADNPGIWLFHCHVNDHLDAGMIARFKVKN